MNESTYEELYALILEMDENDNYKNHNDYAHDVCEYIQENYEALKNESYNDMLYYGMNKINDFIKNKEI